MLKREVRRAARGDFVVVRYPRLQALAGKLRPLIESATAPENRSPLDYLLGAGHALFRAKELKYKPRQRKLFEDQGGPLDNAYWRPGPRQRVKQLAEGKVRLEGKWLAGFYFNSALARLAAVLDRAARAQAIEARLVDGHGFRLERVSVGQTRSVKPRSRPSLEQLLRELGWQRFWDGKLAAVYREVNKLKHDPEGLSPGRKIHPDDAIAAFDEAVQLMETRRKAAARW